MLPVVFPRVATHSRNALPIHPGSAFPVYGTIPLKGLKKRTKSEAKLSTAEKQAEEKNSLPHISSSPSISVKWHKGIWGDAPPRAGAWRKHLDGRVFDKNRIFDPHESPPTEFRRYFERGDLPIAVKHGARPSIDWKVERSKLDYVHHLPIFIDGLLEKAAPYDFLAQTGLQQLIHAGRGNLLEAIPRCIQPLKRCLSTKDPPTICKALNALQEMIRADTRIGEFLVPYYRQLLPVCRLFRAANQNLGDGIEYSQRKRNNLGDLIYETLELLEQTGGPDAFINIKYLVPTYDSVGNR